MGGCKHTSQAALSRFFHAVSVAKGNSTRSSENRNHIDMSVMEELDKRLE
jgi:hypothetical protein